MKTLQAITISIPFGNKEQAIKVGNKLLKAGLITIYKVSENVYLAWLKDDDVKKGEVEHDDIAVLLVKTMSDKINEIHRLVKKHHPWDTFCFTMHNIIDAC